MIPAFLTRYCVSNAQMNLDRWWKLAEFLITKYNDGYVQDEAIPARSAIPKMAEEELKKNPEKFILKDKRRGEKRALIARPAYFLKRL